MNDNYTYGPEVECPWCHRIILDAWELFNSETSEDAEVDCDHCEKPITITRVVSVDYRVEKRPTTIESGEIR